MRSLKLTAAVLARLEICRLALARGSDEAVQQAFAELGEDVLCAVATATSVRLAKLPKKASAVPVVVDVELRPKRRSRA